MPKNTNATRVGCSRYHRIFTWTTSWPWKMGGKTYFKTCKHCVFRAIRIKQDIIDYENTLDSQSRLEKNISITNYHESTCVPNFFASLDVKNVLATTMHERTVRGDPPPYPPRNLCGGTSPRTPWKPIPPGLVS